MAPSTSLAFSDLDLDPGTAGGEIQWQVPDDTSRVVDYLAYLAADAAGTGKSQVGSAVALGTNAVGLPAGTAFGAGSTHVVLYMRSSLGEQTTPTALELSDSVVTVSNVGFTDLDLDLGQIGGSVTWDMPAENQFITAFLVYVATGAAGAGRSHLGTITSNPLAAALPADKPIESYTHVLVYAASALAEQTTPGALEIEDEAASVSSVAFQDLDLDGTDVAGDVTWDAPADVTLVTLYSVYLAIDPGGGLKSQVGADLDVGTREGTNGVDTNGVTANHTLFDRHFLVLLLTFSLPDMPGHTFFRSGIIHYFCSGHISVDPIGP